MNTRGKFEIDVVDFADSLANDDADKQALFFNTFFKSLRMGCGTSYKTDMQLCFINEKLNEKTQENIKFLTYED